MDLTPRPTLANGLQPLSCLRCARHKVRCDRLNPCSRCDKNDAACKFLIPKTEKRRRRNTVKTSATLSPLASAATSTSALNDKLSARLDLYEEKLKSLGVDVESINTSALNQRYPPIFDVLPLDSIFVPRQGPADNSTGGQLDVHSKRCPYVEAATLDKTAHGRDVNAGTMLIDPATDTDMGIGRDSAAGCEHAVNSSALTLGMLPGTAACIDNRYPPQQHFAKLWQIYLRNVQPITMVLHPVSTGAILAEAARDPGHVSKGADVLLFAVMTAAVMSMTEEECVKTFATKQSTLSSSYRSGCELALARVEFLMSCNFAVLQAYTVYLSAVSADLDPRELWNLTGIAKRNAQRLSLHQEDRIKDLTPFDVEMRRRLWHQIVIHDAMSAQATGLQWPDPQVVCELKPPTNINDSDLSPTMQEPANPRVGATDMMFCNLRYKLIKFVGRVNGWCRRWLAPGENQGAAVDRSYRSDRQSIMDSMEKDVELDILRYCDMLSPLHVLTASVARLALCKQRFIMLKASQYGVESSSSQAAEDGENMLSTAIRVLEYENNVLSQPSIRGFLWYMQQDFLWSCLVHILQCFKARPSGEQADKAWEQIGRLYELRSSCYQGPKQKFALHIHAAIRTMTLEAWRAREIHASQCEMLPTPMYITILRDQEQQCLGSGHQVSSLEPPLPADFSHTPRHQAKSDLLFPINFEQDMVNWPNWLGLDVAYGDASSVDLFSSAPVFRSETSTSTQSFDNNAGPSGSPLYPSTYTRRHVYN